MLYFSKLRIIFISIFSLFFIFIASNNLLNQDNRFIDKKINLGLDLQGGSYLLLEIDNAPVIEQKLQNTSTLIRSFFKEKNIRISNLNLTNDKLSFSVEDNFKQQVIDEFKSQNSDINPYYPVFKSHQFNLEEVGVLFEVSFSNQGLVELKTSSQDQALEIVRRRIDEIGTNEPNILKEVMTVF
jgi:preprotein translocase subunit SecD